MASEPTAASTTVFLKSGVETPRMLVLATTQALTDLWHHDHSSFHSFVEAARNPAYRMFPHTGEKLKATGLVETVNANGTVTIHEGVREIVLDAVVGNGFLMKVVSPVRT